MAAHSTLSLVDAIPAQHILIHPESVDRSAVIRALIRQLVDTGAIGQSQASTATRLINEREAKGSTAIGNGVALPHAQIRFVDTIIAAFALLQSGTGFNALDGAPVQYVFLALIPKEHADLHVQLMKTITRFAKDPIHLKALSGCRNPEEVHGVFRDYA